MTGFPRNVGVASVSYTLVNCTGFENVGNWSVKKDGVPAGNRLSASVRGNTIVVQRSGIMLIVR